METKTLNIREKLSAIQNDLNVPKKQWNKFGEFWFRSGEDILEASKPVCKKYRTVLTLHDEIVEHLGRIYVRGVATLRDLDSDEEIKNYAYARESEIKKGMDASQLTGTASSYARKYALNGLFNLDDNKDADTDEFKKQEQEEEPKATEKQLQLIQDLYKEDVENLKGLLNQLSKTKITELTVKEASELIKNKKG